MSFNLKNHYQVYPILLKVFFLQVLSTRIFGVIIFPIPYLFVHLSQLINATRESDVLSQKEPDSAFLLQHELTFLICIQGGVLHSFYSSEC